VAEEKEKEKEEETKEKKGSPLKLVLIVVAVLVLAGAGFVAWQLFLTPDTDDMGAEAIPTADQEAELEDTLTQTYAMDTFVVNLNDPGGKRYLKTNIELEYISETLGEELARRLPQLRDLILLLLSSKSLDDIQSVDGKIALRRELIQRINQTLTSGKIRNLYFTQFVIQ
jgi:flagellar FliL protein